MKKKLLLFLLFNLLFGFFLSSKNIKNDINFYHQNFKFSSKSIYSDTTKKQKKNSRSLKNLRVLAVLPSPLITAGSSCSDGVNPVQVNVYAFGVNGNETIEWFTSQSSGIPIYTGSVYSPSISATRTYYVRSRSGGDISIRVPVVASVYIVPPAVFLTVSPANSTSSPLCIGTSVTFTATGGGDLFEFSVDGVVKQAMTTNKIFVTNVLTDGQVVRVRTRYAVNFDGNITEKAWGTGSLEDNFLSAPLSSSASTGYINSLKISSTEDKLIFGVLGKALSNRRILLFLDTKTGGFNISNYGDEAGSIPTVNAFNYFNNNPSTFDSYFQADYCLAIGTDLSETNYSADIIELRTGNSIKTNLGIAATGIPSSVMGVNKNNAGINDYSLGFEVEILKSLLGYTTGDIKFFAVTLADQDEPNYLVTNSFLSPERTSNLDYGNGAVDYNLKDPNPVVVAASALTPCYSEANITMNFVDKPTVAAVGGNQSKCVLTSDPLGGNTPSVGTGSWSKKSGPGAVAFSDSTNGSSTASVSVEGVYVFTWTITNGQCTPSSADISVEYIITPSPVVDTITQPTCADNSGSVLLRGLPSVGTWIITPSSGSPVSGSGSTYEFRNLLASTSYTFTVTGLNNCPSVPSSPVSINAIPTPPVVPTTVSVIQPTCATPSG
ncbi:immunoglobulin domain-containing protein, partial [Flavobacterium xueshanense]